VSSNYVTEPHTSGKVVLHTTLGALDVELWPKESPKAVRNFVQLCLEGFYDNCLFHRLIKDFIIQTGDPTGTGTGGESIYGGDFPKEFHSRLRFTHRGILAMAGGPDGNLSQFFITLDKTPQLDRKHTIFGKLTGNAIYNLLPVNDLQVDADERPLFPPKIIRTEVLFNPFDDIVPRVRVPSAEEIAAKQTATEAASATAALAASKRVVSRNVLSFVEDDDDNDDDDGNSLAKKPIKLVPVHEKPTPMMLEAQAKKKRRKRDESSSSSSSSSSSGGSDDQNRKGNDNNDNSRDSSRSSSDDKAAREAAQRRLEEERRLKAEIRAARGDATASTKKPSSSAVRLDGDYDIAAKRAKFSSNKSAGADSKSRTKDVLAKLAGFSSKVRQTEATPLATTENETRCELHSRVKCESCAHNVARDGDDSSADDPKALFSHSLVFQKEAKHADQMTRRDDEFEVTDFRKIADPLAAERAPMPIDRDEQARREAIRSGGHHRHSSKGRDRERSGKHHCH
jgi:peptidyl-prolyl cis-trans isomerase SDCCAG10